MAEPAAQRIVVRQQPVDLDRQRFQAGQIHHPDRPAPDLVLIGRSDAAAGRADLGAGIGGGVLAEPVELAVQRQDERGVLGDLQAVRRDVDALRLELGDLGDEGMRIEHDAVADDRQLAVAHDAGRQQRQLVDLAVDDQRVPGIVAALEADHHIRALGQPVDDLALALVAPLRADDHHIGHSRFPRLRPARSKAGVLTGLYRQDPETLKPVFVARAVLAAHEAQCISRCSDHLLERGRHSRSGPPSSGPTPRCTAKPISFSC